MKKNIHPSEARRILSKVPVNTSFWLCTNEYLRNLEDLGSSLQKANDDIFRYHVNKDKNDFEKWIREVINDKELAREISRIKTKETLVRKISERVSALRVLTNKIKKKAEKRAKKAKLKGKKKR